MSRSVSSVLKRAIYHSSTERVFQMLHQIEHADLPEPLRYTSNGAPVVSGGVTYNPSPFRITLPTESEEVPSASFEIDNTDRVIVEAIRSISTKPDFSMWVVLDDDPDRIEAGPWRMRLSNARYNAANVQMNVEGPSVISEPFPSKSYNSEDYPGIR